MKVILTTVYKLLSSSGFHFFTNEITSLITPSLRTCTTSMSRGPWFRLTISSYPKDWLRVTTFKSFGGKQNKWLQFFLSELPWAWLSGITLWRPTACYVAIGTFPTVIALFLQRRRKRLRMLCCWAINMFQTFSLFLFFSLSLFL